MLNGAGKPLDTPIGMQQEVIALHHGHLSITVIDRVEISVRVEGAFILNGSIALRQPLSTSVFVTV